MRADLHARAQRRDPAWDELMADDIKAWSTVRDLRAEAEKLREALRESEHAMHMRVRAGYDSTIRETWQAEVARAVAAEREACAKVCDEVSDIAEREIEGDRRDWPKTVGESCGADRCAELIRARGAVGGA